MSGRKHDLDHQVLNEFHAEKIIAEQHFEDGELLRLTEDMAKDK